MKQTVASNNSNGETSKVKTLHVVFIGAYGPDRERIKLHCFFAKTIGTVPVFVGSVSFFLCRVNAPSLWLKKSIANMASRLHYGFEDAYFKISSDFEKVLVSSCLIITKLLKILTMDYRCQLVMSVNWQINP